MARRIVPRRLSHDEEATLVEHLTELRHRLLICIIALAPAFAIAYAFHEQLIGRLMDLVPEGTPIVPLKSCRSRRLLVATGDVSDRP